MIMNFIGFVICIMAITWQGTLGNIGCVIILSGLALMNLPFAIKWLKDFLD